MNKKREVYVFIILVLFLVFYSSNCLAQHRKGGRGGGYKPLSKDELNKVTQQYNMKNFKGKMLKKGDNYEIKDGSYTDKFGHKLSGTFTIDSNGNIVSSENINIDNTEIKNAKKINIKKDSFTADNIEYVKDKDGKWTVKNAEKTTKEKISDKEILSITNGDLDLNDFSSQDITASVKYIADKIKNIIFTSNKDNNKAKIKLKNADAVLVLNKNNKANITILNNSLKKIQMPKNALLKFSFNISPKIFGIFKAKSNNSFFQELGNNRYKIKNGIFEYNNGYIEELSNCKDCEFTLNYITGIICLYMSNSSLYNYHKDNNSDFAFYSLQNYTLCFQKTEQKINENYTGLINLYNNYYDLSQKYYLMKRFPKLKDFFIASNEQKQETFATLDNSNNIITKMSIKAAENKNTLADSGCFKIFEANNTRFAKAENCTENIINNYETSYFEPKIIISPDLVQKAENSTAIIFRQNSRAMKDFALVFFAFFLFLFLPRRRATPGWV